MKLLFLITLFSLHVHADIVTIPENKMVMNIAQPTVNIPEPQYLEPVSNDTTVFDQCVKDFENNGYKSDVAFNLCNEKQS